MRTLLALGIALSLFAAKVEAASTTTTDSSATKVAQEKSDKSKKKKKKKKADAAKASAAAKSKAEDDALLASVPAAPAAQTTTAPVAAVAPPAKKWSVGLYSESYADINAIRNDELKKAGGAQVETFNTPSISYKINPKTSVTLAQDSITDFGNPGMANTYLPLDAQLRLTNSELLTIGHSAKVNSQLRLYLPTSEPSRTSGQLAQIRWYGTLEKVIGKLTVAYTLNPRFYIQQTKTHLDTKSGSPTFDQEVANTEFKVLNVIDIGYDLTSKWNLATEFALYNAWTYGDSNLAISEKHADYLYSESFVNYNAADWVTLSFGIITDANGTAGVNISGNNSFSLYDPSNTSYDFRANFTL